MMLTCRDVAAQASDYIDRALAWRSRLALALHLRMCAACREYVRQLTLVAGSLRRLPLHPEH